MSDRRNIIISIIVFLLFFLLFPINLKPGISYIPGDSAILEGDLKSITGEKIPFIYKKTAGFFSKDLKSSWSINVNDGITLMDNGFINLNRENDSFDFINMEGNIDFSIVNNGYPFSISNRLFIVSRDRKSISEIVDKQIKWVKEFNHIITSIDGNGDKIVLGFVKGFYSVLDSDGEVTYSYEPGGSRVPVVYSVLISSDSNYVGVVSGLDPQRFTLYEKKVVEYKPVYAFNIEDQIRRRHNMYISSDNKNIFVEDNLGFYMIDIINRSSKLIKTESSLKSVEYIKNHDIYLIHTAATNYNNIKLLTKDNHVLLNKSFNGENVSVNSLDNSIYIVIDGRVLKLDIKEIL